MKNWILWHYLFGLRLKPKVLISGTYQLLAVYLLGQLSNFSLALLSVRDWIIDLRLILILPDREKGTISKGHLFRPRYLTFVDGDFMDVVAVLAKMVGHTRISHDK